MRIYVILYVNLAPVGFGNVFDNRTHLNN